MNDFITKKIEKFREKFAVNASYGYKLNAEFADVESFLQQAIEEAQEETAKKLSRLPFHPEVTPHEGGTSIRQVTYTTDIVQLESELKKK